MFTQTQQLYISIFTISKESYTSLQALYAVQCWLYASSTEQLSAVSPPGKSQLSWGDKAGVSIFAPVI